MCIYKFSTLKICINKPYAFRCLIIYGSSEASKTW